MRLGFLNFNSREPLAHILSENDRPICSPGRWLGAPPIIVQGKATCRACLKTFELAGKRFREAGTCNEPSSHRAKPPAPRRQRGPNREHPLHFVFEGRKLRHVR